MQRLAKFLAATGRRLGNLGKVICHFFRKRKLEARDQDPVLHRDRGFVGDRLGPARMMRRGRLSGLSCSFGLSMLLFLAEGTLRDSPRSIATGPLLPRQVEEQSDRFFLPPEMMDPHLPQGPDPPPSTYQTGFSEQRRGNLHGVEAGHVLRGVSSLDVELVGLRDHIHRVADHGQSVQRHM